MPDVIPLFSIAQYATRAVCLIIVGIVAVNILARTGIFSRFTKISRPLCRISGLSDGAALSIIAMAVNATAGKSMLAEYHRDGKVDKKEIIPALLIGTFPVVFGESLFRVQLPTAIVLLGPVVGGIYTLLNLFSAFLQALAALLYTRLVLTHKSGRLPVAAGTVNGTGTGNANANANELPEITSITPETVREGVRQSIPTLKRVLPATITAILAFYVLSLTGLMDFIGMAFGPVLHLAGLPGESTAALVAQFMHFSAGYAVVASLMIEGVLTIKQAIITLIIGSMVVITMIYIKYSVPLYLSLFGKEGVRISIITYASSMTAKIVCISLVILIF